MTDPQRAMSADLGPVLDKARVIISVGTGGVGKTTTAAALAVEGARRGRRAAVVTIDPARRLADALGLAGLSDTPSRIDGPWPGELWALMLDPKATFDRLIRTHAQTEAQATRIEANPLYRNISATLSGTQEYMAMEQLYALDADGDFDLIVVDTPPARHARDFLDAPGTLTRFLDHRLTRAIVAPSGGLGRIVSSAAQTFLRTVAVVVGRAVVDDAIAFFEAFEGMEAGFRTRAIAVDALLGRESTAFVLVASAQPETVTEARQACEHLAQDGRPVQALILNRLHPRFGVEPEQLASRTTNVTPDRLGPLLANLTELEMVADREEHTTAELVQMVSPAPVARVPLFREDVHDLAGITSVADCLFPS